MSDLEEIMTCTFLLGRAISQMSFPGAYAQRLDDRPRFFGSSFDRNRKSSLLSGMCLPDMHRIQDFHSKKAPPLESATPQFRLGFGVFDDDEDEDDP